MKCVSVRELSQKGASAVVTAAEAEPVLISKHGEPAAWIVSAAKLAKIGNEGDGGDSIYRDALRLIAMDLFQNQVLSLGKASRLAVMSLSDFIDLCGQMRVPVLFEPEEGFAAEVAAAKVWLAGGGAPTAPPVDERVSVELVAPDPVPASLAATPEDADKLLVTAVVWQEVYLPSRVCSTSCERTAFT
jgi:prevent-host-death family protein